MRRPLAIAALVFALGVGSVALWPSPAGPPAAPPVAPPAVPDAALPAACADAFTPIPAIQGSGPATPMAGRLVTTEGVVVGDFQGPAPALRGFYLQDPEGDGDPATSDGIFVFLGDEVAVQLGDRVRVTGLAGEFQGQTQLSRRGAIVACGHGTVAPTEVRLPVPDAGYLERYEGMLVRFPQTLVVTEHHQLAHFGELVLAPGDRLWQPTQVAEPGAPALALQAANDRHRLLLDDARNDQDPDPIVFGRGGEPLSAGNTLRAGDEVTGLTGLLTYGWAGHGASPNAYRLRPVGATGGGPPDFQAGNPRPAAPPDVGGRLRVGVLNLLNYFKTFEGCTAGVAGPPTDCRGAADANELERQAAKLVATVVGMDVDVLAVVEVANDGYGEGSALADLTARLDAASQPGTWAFVDADAGSGRVDALGRDAIKVGLLFRPAAVAPLGPPAVFDDPAFVTGGDRLARNRPALAQAFREHASGEAFVAAVVHLKSKGSPCDAPDAGDGQGNCSAVRTAAAERLAAWLAADPTGASDPDVLLLGDLNAYAREDAVARLEAAGYVNLQPHFAGPASYTYGFAGQWGALDHALASASLAPQVTGAAAWHVNADEPRVLDYATVFRSEAQLASLYAPDPYRSSDHDPLLVGLSLDARGR